LGPRLFTYFFGWPNVFTRGNDKYTHHFWIPICGPLIGANLGAVLYKFAIAIPLMPLEQEMKIEKTDFIKSNESTELEEQKNLVC
jgi:hypothetical protein